MVPRAIVGRSPQRSRAERGAEATRRLVRGDKQLRGTWALPARASRRLPRPCHVDRWGSARRHEPGLPEVPPPPSRWSPRGDSLPLHPGAPPPPGGTKVWYLGLAPRPPGREQGQGGGEGTGLGRGGQGAGAQGAGALGGPRMAESPWAADSLRPSIRSHNGVRGHRCTGRGQLRGQRLDCRPPPRADSPRPADRPQQRRRGPQRARRRPHGWGLSTTCQPMNPATAAGTWDSTTWMEPMGATPACLPPGVGPLRTRALV